VTPAAPSARRGALSRGAPDRPLERIPWRGRYCSIDRVAEDAMNRRQPRQAGGPPKIFLRGAGFIFGLGLAGSLAVGTSDQPMPPGQDAAAVALAAEPADGRPPADRQSRARAGETAGQADDGAAGQTPPNADAVPDVAVRVGDHGDFERVAFEWPDALDHDVERRDGQVVVSFGRPGRIDLSGLRDGFGRRVLGATAEGSGDSTRQVVLRVAPNTEVASFSLEGSSLRPATATSGTPTAMPMATPMSASATATATAIADAAGQLGRAPHQIEG
jgi:hypothetical protein